MTEAVIVSTARTPIGKAHRGAFNQVRGADMAAHAIRHALERAGLEPEAVEEVVLGCGYPEAATGSMSRAMPRWSPASPSSRPGSPSAASAPRVLRRSPMPRGGW